VNCKDRVFVSECIASFGIRMTGWTAVKRHDCLSGLAVGCCSESDKFGNAMGLVLAHDLNVAHAPCRSCPHPSFHRRHPGGSQNNQNSILVWWSKTKAHPLVLGGGKTVWKAVGLCLCFSMCSEARHRMVDTPSAFRRRLVPDQCTCSP
jgi:hypothetical protein